MLGRILVAAGTVGAALVLVPAAQAAPPVCTGGFLTTPMNTRLALDALTCTNPGSAPAFSLMPPPEHGDLSGPPYAYTPHAGFHGVDAFSYTLTNTDTGETSNRADVTILVDAAPTCTDATATTPVNVPLRIHELPCDDVDDPDFDVIFDDGSHGVVDVDNGTGDLIYTPSPGFVGTDSFPFFGSDKWGLDSARHRMTITVAPPQPQPTASPTPTSTPTPPRAPDKAAPNVTLKSVGKPNLAKGVSLTLTSNEAGTAKLTLTVDKATARKLRLDRKAKGLVTVGTGAATLVNGATNVTIKLSAKARKAFKTARQVKMLLTVVVSDAAGNKATKTLAVAIKR